MKSKEILEALNWRYGVKSFDSRKKVTEEDLRTILESARLAPSSIGIEPWKFILVENPELRAKLGAAAYNQSKVTEASHLVVIARRTDAHNLADELIARTAKIHGKTEAELAGLKGMATGALGRPAEALEVWLGAQTYIALGMMIVTAALLGVDTGPMEGFDKAQVDEILGLKEKNLAAQSMLAIGYRGKDPYAGLARVRREYAEVVEVM